ncbi:MAG: transglutaminase domain-containing protein [Bacteroidota bacterium]
MKFQYRLLTFFLGSYFSLFSVQVFSNTTLDSASVYSHAESAPLGVRSNPRDLSTYLTKPFSDDASKILSISYWIAQNISYDISLHQPATYSSKKVLQSGTAKADGFVQLFVELCTHSNIPAIAVYGYKRNFDQMPGDTLFRSNHVWVLAQQNQNWHIYDPTLASGSISFKKDLFADVGKPPQDIVIPIEQLLYTKKFNPAWLDIAPEKAAITHHPIIPMFQLLKYPVHIQTFAKGNKAVSSYLSKNKGADIKNEKIDSYAETPLAEQYVTTAEESARNNPHNVRDMAYLYYKSIHLNKKDTYIPETESFMGSFEVLQPMRKHAYIADSLFEIAEDNNDREYDIFKNRSELWEDSLIDRNKMYTKILKTRLRENEQYVKKINRVQDKLNKSLAEITENTGIHPNEIIENTNRPAQKDNDEMYEAFHLKKEIDSIALLADSVVQKFYSREDKVFADLYAGSRKNQYHISTCYQTISKQTQGILQYKKNNIQLVYYSEDTVIKPKIQQNLDKAEKLRKDFLDAFIPALEEYQKFCFYIVKDYTDVMSEQIEMIVELKENSVKEKNEDNLYIQTVETFEDNMREMAKTITIQQEQITILAEMLEKEVGDMTSSLNYLDVEEDYEKIRNDTYETFIENRADKEEEMLDRMSDEVGDVLKILTKMLDK